MFKKLMFVIAASISFNVMAIDRSMCSHLGEFGGKVAEARDARIPISQIEKNLETVSDPALKDLMKGIAQVAYKNPTASKEAMIAVTYTQCVNTFK